MVTGGQVKSGSPSGTTAGAPSAGSSDFPPPNRLLKRSPRDCDDAGEASMPQPIPNEIAATIAILGRRAAVMAPRLSPITTSLVPGTLRLLPPRPGYNSNVGEPKASAKFKN